MEKRLRKEKNGCYGEQKKTKKKVKALKSKVAYLEQALEAEKSRCSEMEREFRGERKLMQLQMSSQIQGWILEVLAKEFIPEFLKRYGLPGKGRGIPEIVDGSLS